MTSVRPLEHSRVLLVLGVWCSAAVAAGAAGLIARARPPFPQLIIVLLTGVVMLAFARASRFRAWALTIDLRALVALHLVRFVGIYFLWLYGRGRLPYEFAVKGGWGDIVTASLALLLIASTQPDRRGGRVLYLLWNAFGLADIVFVVTTAARLAQADPKSMSELLVLPLSLLPTFVVPLIFASHVVMVVRLVTTKRGQALFTGP